MLSHDPSAAPDPAANAPAANAPAARPASEADAPSAQALKQAFLRGAGLAPAAIGAPLTLEMMELLGALMAKSLQGSIDLLAMRSLVKQEVQAEVTTVLVRNNNPLKFFPDSQTVLTQMLRKKMPGFMEPLEALDDAWTDLHAHQRGVLAGHHAAMRAAIDQLEQGQIDAALPPPRLAERLLPLRRVQRRWDEYRRRHRQIVAEHGAGQFGPVFLQAYEAAVAGSAEAAA